MFPITRLAIKATRIERNAIKTLTKVSKKYGEQGAQELKEVLELNNFPGKTIKPYSKNPFKRMVFWVKTFFENYKLLKYGIKSKISFIKEQYGMLFTKKRQKFVKNSIINGVKDFLKEFKRGWDERELELKAEKML